MIISLIFLLVVGGFALTSAVTDAWKKKIPNWLTVPVAGAGLLFHTVLWILTLTHVVEPQQAVDQIISFDNMSAWLLNIGPWAYVGFLVGFVLLFLPAYFGGAGFGDVKMFAALGAWLGVDGVLIAFVLSILYAAVFTIVVLCATGPMKAMRRVRKMQKDAKTPKNQRSQKAKKSVKRLLPFAIPTCCGILTFLALFVCNHIQNFWNFMN